jgi:hypothetical protein
MRFQHGAIGALSACQLLLRWSFPSAHEEPLMVAVSFDAPEEAQGRLAEVLTSARQDAC